MKLHRLLVALVFAFLLTPASQASARSSVASATSRVHHLVVLVRGDRHTVWWLQRRAHRTRERPAILRRRRAALRWHLGLLAAARRQLELAATPRSWLAAVDEVGRFFGAGVAGWERSCSQPTSEGGWGRWVPNSQGSGAGGWLQFMPSTFGSVIGPAIAAARQRGMLVPASAWSWYSPLGQALAGVEMLADGRRGEWSGWGC